jgi:histidinol-phosphate phosphatase family protein
MDFPNNVNISDKPLVILDRDGTVIVDKHYLSEANDVELLPHAAEGLKLLTAIGLPLVVVTNQSGVGRGFFRMQDVDAVHDRLRTILGRHQIELAGIFVCPHAPDDGCDCRKPLSGLVRRAARELGVNLSRTFTIGDKACDIQLGHNLGGQTFLISNGRKDVWKAGKPPDFVVANLLAAAKIIESLVRR